MNRTPFARPTLSLIALTLSAQLSAAVPTANLVDLESGWETAASVAVDLNTGKLIANGEGDEIVFTNGPDAAYLVGKSHYSDQIVSFEYLALQGALAGAFLQGRYEVVLSGSVNESPSESSSGALAGGFNRNTDSAFDPVPPLVDATLAENEWQSVSLRFRTLRNDEASNKLSNSFFLDLTINGIAVQKAVPIEYYTDGSPMGWEQIDGPLVFRVRSGSFAIRNLSIDHANFDELRIGDGTEPGNLDTLVDQVELGKETFTAMGCIECHTTKKDDTSFKTGPNLYGLFQNTPRKREVVEPGTKARFKVDADRSYAFRSIRSPNDELSIAESGPNEGKPFLPVMAPYSEDLLSNQKVDAIWRYLSTLNDEGQRGPVQVLVPQGGPAEYDPLADTMELLASQRTRIQRGSMQGVSGRSIHVGQPDGINYTFDPRALAVEKLWQGGFINGAGEWENRGGGGFQPGYESKAIELGGQSPLIAPLLPNGEMVDFSFKEALFHDWDAINASLYNEKDHLELLAAIDAQFLGYSIDSTNPNASPTFNYRIAQNTLSLQLRFDPSGSISFHLSGNLDSEQKFAINQSALASPSVDAGKLDENGIWTLPPAKSFEATLEASIGLSSKAWRPENSNTEYLRQELKVEPTEAKLPAGYRSEQFLPPHDNFGRELLFEATGIAVAPDGTVVVGTRTSGIWRIVDGEWRLFAEGLFDCLGLVVEDESGLQIVASQKPELTRISDTNGDGIADSFETLSDQFSYHSNYHSYMHGPVRDSDGNYYYLLNLLHTDKAIYKGAGLYMGTSGGFSGWAIKVTPEGEFIPWASGLRSPAGLGIDESDTIWYADNQGEYVGTSKLFILQQDKFYGHPSGLVDLPGMNPDSSEIQWPEIGYGKERAIALFPHNRVANSPGHMTWDETAGKFGPYQGQMFIGDQTQSKLLRVSTFQIDGQIRGAVFPFGNELQSGLMRPVFLPDGSLLVGQTGRGWHARGGKIASLQRIVWDGRTLPADILTASVNAEPADTISLAFTSPLSENIDENSLSQYFQLASWTYRDAPDYGSPELHRIEHFITESKLAKDRRSITLTLESVERPTQEFQTARVYHLVVDSTELFDGTAPAQLEAYITGE